MIPLINILSAVFLVVFAARLILFKRRGKRYKLPFGLAAWLLVDIAVYSAWQLSAKPPTTPALALVAFLMCAALMFICLFFKGNVAEMFNGIICGLKKMLGACLKPFQLQP